MPNEKTGRKKAKHKKPIRIRSVDYHSVFDSTIETYLECAYLISVGNIPANNPDPMAMKPLALTFRAEYVTDIEQAVRRVLKREHEQACFDRILREMAQQSDPDPAFTLGQRVEVIQLVGREIERRKLKPSLYFYRDKYKRRTKVKEQSSNSIRRAA